MPQFNYTLTGTIDVPEGSTLTDKGTGIILPDGRIMKIWEVLEVHTPEKDDYANLTHDEAIELGLHYDGLVCRFQEA